MRAVTNSDQPVGIPQYNFDKMLNILDQALSYEEKDLICRGYGIQRERQSQKEIAAELNIDTSEVSMRAHHAVKRLQASPYKAQLRALVPTLEELFGEIISLRKANESLRSASSNSETSRTLKHRCQSLQNSLEQSKQACKGYETENNRLIYEIDKIGKKLEDTKSQLVDSTAQIARLTSQVASEKARADIAKQAFDEVLDGVKTVLDTAQDNFIADVANVAISTGTLEGLHLPESTIERLRRAGINSLTTLCGTPKHALLKLGVGEGNVVKIEKELLNQGLSLRIS